MKHVENGVCDKHQLRRATVTMPSAVGGVMRMCTECVEIAFGGAKHGVDVARLAVGELPPVMPGLIDPEIEASFMRSMMEVSLDNLKKDCSSFAESLSNSEPMMGVVAMIIKYVGLDAHEARHVCPLYHLMLASYKAGSVGSLGAMLKL